MGTGRLASSNGRRPVARFRAAAQVIAFDCHWTAGKRRLAGLELSFHQDLDPVIAQSDWYRDYPTGCTLETWEYGRAQLACVVTAP